MHSYFRWPTSTQTFFFASKNTLGINKLLPPLLSQTCLRCVEKEETGKQHILQTFISEFFRGSGVFIATTVPGFYREINLCIVYLRIRTHTETFLMPFFGGEWVERNCSNILSGGTS